MNTGRRGRWRDGPCNQNGAMKNKKNKNLNKREDQMSAMNGYINNNNKKKNISVVVKHE